MNEGLCSQGALFELMKRSVGGASLLFSVNTDKVVLRIPKANSYQIPVRFSVASHL